MSDEEKKALVIFLRHVVKPLLDGLTAEALEVRIKDLEFEWGLK